MNKIFKSNISTSATHIALLVARVGIAALMLTHGIPKLVTLFSGEPIQFLPFMGMSATTSLALTVFAEVVCSVLILVGLTTRLAVIPLIITMLVAIGVVHLNDPIGKQEPAIHYLIVYVVLLLAGAGKYSLDNLLFNKQSSARQKNQIEDPTLAVYQ